MHDLHGRVERHTFRMRSNGAGLRTETLDFMFLFSCALQPRERAGIPRSMLRREHAPPLAQAFAVQNTAGGQAAMI